MITSLNVSFMFKTELLMPAGSLKALKYAIFYGADAIYAGKPRYSLRVRNNEFDDLDIIKESINLTRKYGKKFYLVNNILAHNNKIKTYLKDIKEIIDFNPDAFIMADPGLISLTKENYPDLEIHLSVQANTLNYKSCKFWYKQGIKRIILSRELRLDEIAEIKQLAPEIEIEVFVHGSLCVAYSGRCLISNYTNSRDANQGSCTNACRWKYDVALIKEKENREFIVEEDIHGSYILNSKDLCAIRYLKKLMEIGVDSFKIEGRTKSIYHISRITQIYRNAIDDICDKGDINLKYFLNNLNKLSNRGYTEGFFQKKHTELQNYIKGSSSSDYQKFVGEIDSYNNIKKVKVIVKNKIQINDKLELITKNKNIDFTLDNMSDMQGNSLHSALGSGYIVYIDLSKLKIDKNQLKYALIAKYIN